MKHLILIQLALLGLCICAHASAAPASSAFDIQDAKRQQDHIIMQEQEYLRKQQEGFLYGKEAPPEGLRVPNLEDLAIPQDAPCVAIDTIEVTGVSLFPQSKIRKLVDPYEKQCLSLADINNILRRLTNLYIDAGYVTSRAFMDTAKAEQGGLRILIVEGTLEKIIINDGDKKYYLRGLTAFPHLKGKPLNLRDIEQGLDQLNRLPSGDATLELIPGEKLGGTIAKVTIPPAKSWRTGGGIDNLGQRSSGHYQHNIFFEKDNLIGVGDQLAVYWSENAPYLESLRSTSRDGRDSHSFSAYASVPYGYWTLSANMSRFSYRSPLYGKNAVYMSSGTSTSYGGQLERVIHRDADSKTSLSAALAGRHVKNYIEDAYLDASSYFLATFTTGLSHQRRLLGGSLAIGMDYTQGLPWFGTKKQQEYAHETPRSLFHKYSASIQWYRPFTVQEQSFYYHLSGQGQLAKQTLYSAERIFIGSKYSVRGYHDSSLSGDQGGYARNELGWSVPLPTSWNNRLPINTAQIYAAYDVGGIIKDRKDPYERGVAHGVGLGLRTTGPVGLDISVAKPVSAPHFIKTRDAEFYMALRITF